MKNLECGHRPTRSMHLAVAAFVLTSFALSCASSQDSSAGKELRSPSLHGDRAYMQAREAWGRLYASGLDKASQVQGLHDVIEKLEQAAYVDPKNVLLHSKMGDIHLDLGDVKEAIRDYVTAVELCPDWALGWVGLAHCAALEGKKEETEKALLAVTWSLASLRQWGVPEPPGFLESLLSAFGISIPREPERRAVGDPSIDPKVAQGMIYGWLKESLAWSPANAAILGGASAFVEGDIERRVMARAEYLRALVVAEGPVPEGRSKHDMVIEAVDAALDRDHDYFDARLLKAYAHLQKGESQIARALLEPYVGDRNPMLANHDLLIELLCKAYVGEYIRKPDLATRGRAVSFFTWIHELHGRLESSFWNLASDWFRARAENKQDELESLGEKLRSGNWIDLDIDVLRRGLLEDLQRARVEKSAVGSGPSGAGRSREFGS